MSGPYDSYGQQPYGSQYPAQGYNQQSQYPPQGYNQQPQYGQPQQYPTYDQNQNFGPPRRADSFGPPSAGGFQHGQEGVAYGQYGASNPQGHSGYYGQTQPQQYGSNDAYAQNQAYQAGLGQDAPAYGQTQPDAANHEFARQSSDVNAPNYDPNAPPMGESDRGLLGALGGGATGAWAGRKAGHGFLGLVGGAIAGSLAEDYAKKEKRKHHRHGNQSSWGGRN